MILLTRNWVHDLMVSDCLRERKNFEAKCRGEERFLHQSMDGIGRAVADDRLVGNEPAVGSQSCASIIIWPPGGG